MKHIVKRHGLEEHFDSKKVFTSSFRAAKNVHLTDKEAKQIADQVCQDINVWIGKKSEVNSGEIFKEVIKSLKKLNKDAAFMYETHRDIS